MTANRLNTHLRSLILLCMTLFMAEGMATHLVGGNLSYEYIGQNDDGTYRYRVYSETFTDCGPTSNFPDPEENIPVAIYANDLNDPDANKTLVTEFNMPRVSFEEVSLEIPDGCDIGSDVCLERALYEFFVDLPLNFGGYWLYYDRCCRNDAVVNLSELQGVGFTTYIPSPLVENSSPFFNAPPTPFLCAGDTATFLNSAVDPDGDLLVFSFINPLRGYSTDVDPNPGAGGYDDPLLWEVAEANYNPGFSVDQPFGAGGYSFINGATGLTSYSVPSAGQYSVAIEIREYRNDVLIGITRRDLQLTVINCPVNPSPDLSNESAGNIGPTEWEINEGDTLCFPVIFLDENGDQLTLTSLGEVFDPNLVVPTASINTPQTNVGQVQGDFCWFTDCDQGREVPYFFSATATDDGCPPKSASEVFTIEVIPFTGSTMLDGESAVCENATEVYSTDLFDGGSYVWSVSGGTISDGQGTNTVTVEWGSAGAGMLTVTSTNFRGCVGDPFDLSVAIQPLPEVDAGADIAICLGDSVDIGGAPTGPLGSFFVWGPNNNIDNTAASNPMVFPQSTTVYDVEVISGNNCTARDSIMITVNEAQLSVSDDVSICSGTSTQLEASGATTYTWSPGATLDQDDVAMPNASPGNTTTYTVESVDANSCEASAEITVTVFEQPVANAGPNQTLCGLAVDMAAVPSTGESTWTPPANANVDGNMANSNASTLIEGTYTFTWTESTGDGLCTSSDEVDITFIEQPVANAGLDQVVCGLEFTLEAIPSAGTGLWNLPVELSIDPNAQDPNGTITSSSFGVFPLIWVEDNMGCTDAATVSIEFVEQPVANAGLDDDICGDSYVLDASVSGGTGTWSGPANVEFTDVNDPNAEVNTGAFGTQTLTWTVDNNGNCETAVDVDITFNETPVANAGVDQDICGLDGALEAISSIGVGTWTVPAGLNVDDLNSASSDVNANALGQYTLTWTEDSNGCIDSDEVTLDFLQMPVPDAGLDDDICGDSYVLGASTDIGSGEWSSSANVSFDDISDANATASVSNFGTETMTWTAISDEGCEAQASVDITFFEIPEANAGTDISICGTEIELAAIPSIGDGIWSGPAQISLDDNSSPEAIATTGVLGTYTMTWTEDANGCVDSDEVDISFLEVPNADAGADDDVCIGSSVELDASGGDTYTWSPADDLSDPNSDEPDASPSQTTVYTVLVELDNGCFATDSMTLTVNDLPVVSAGEDVDYLCFGDSLQLQGSPGFAGYEWSPSDNLSADNIADPFVGPFAPQAETLSYELTVTDSNGCENSDTVVLTVNPDVPTAAGADTLICAGEPVVLGGMPVAPSGSSFTWSPDTDIDDINAQNPTVTPTATTTYTVSTFNGICTGSDQVTVSIEENPDMSFDITAAPSCVGLDINFINTGDASLSYTWDFGDGSTSTDFSPSHIYPFNAQYMVVLTGISELGCTYETDTLLDATDFASYFDLRTPNVFSPNGDGQNDVLDINIIGRVEECLEMEVFNRWGQLVFKASGNNTRWDGRTQAGELVEPGVYFYYLEFNGTSYKGSVQVLR